MEIAVALLGMGIINSSFSQQSGLVNVTINDESILQHAGIRAKVPVTVKLPASIAGHVCGVSIHLLVNELQKGDATCTAKAKYATSNKHFNHFLQAQFGKQRKSDGR